MTAPITFGLLEPVALRAAWPHEARGFTPWLAENIGRLSDAIGIPLEVTGAEVAVGTFSADLLARNTKDGSIALIENQLEEGDHSHLGQILTYLAGLNAQTVVWIAAKFREPREPHLSAIRALNTHTATPFAFFAVQLRVVRIGGSPFAPIFNVLERPSGWDRSLQKFARESREPEDAGGSVGAFWKLFLARYPDEAERSRQAGDGCRWRSPLPGGMIVGLHVFDNRISVFIRGRHGVPINAAMERLAPFKDVLQARLGTTLSIQNESIIAEKRRLVATEDPAHRGGMADWLHAEADVYEAALRGVLRA